MPRQAKRERYEEARRRYVSSEGRYRQISELADELRTETLAALAEFVAAGQELSHAAARGED